MLQKQRIVTAQELGLSRLSSHMVPLKGRRLLITPMTELFGDSKNKTRSSPFKEIYLKSLTINGLFSVIATKLKKKPNEVKAIYLIDARDRLLELEDDEQVEELEEDASIVISFHDDPKK